MGLQAHAPINIRLFNMVVGCRWCTCVCALLIWAFGGFSIDIKMQTAAMRWTSQMCGYILYGCAILPVLNVLMTHLWFLFAILASDWTLNTFWVGICSLPLTVFHIIWALGFASMKRSATKRVRVKVRRKVRIKRKDKQHSARPTPKLALPAPPPPPQLSASGQSQPHKRRLPPPPPPPPPSPPKRPAHTSSPMLLRYPLPLPPPPPPPPLQTSKRARTKSRQSSFR